MPSYCSSKRTQRYVIWCAMRAPKPNYNMVHAVQMHLVTATRRLTVAQILQAEAVAEKALARFHRHSLNRLARMHRPFYLDPQQKQCRYCTNSKVPRTRHHPHGQRRQSAMPNSAVFVWRASIQTCNAQKFPVNTTGRSLVRSRPAPLYCKTSVLVPIYPLSRTVITQKTV